MDVDEALDFANELIRQQTGKPLNDSEIKVFRGSWQGLTYAEIDPISPEYLEKDVGFKLWRKLSQALGKVSKKTFRGVIEAEVRKQRSHSEPPPQPQQPQRYETVFNDTDFVGREEAIAYLNNLITNRRAKVIGIYGKGGIGKTTLAYQYFETQGLALPLELQVGTDSEYITSVERWVKDKLRYNFQEEPEPDFIGMLEQLKRKLQHQPFGVLIDNLETVIDENSKLNKRHRDYAELLIRVLNHPTVKSITLITSRERLNESKLTFIEPYVLPELDDNAWKEFFSHFNINTDSPALSAIHKAYGGNALAMKVLRDPIETDYGGDLETYWQDYKEFLLKGQIKDLIVDQFDRLQKLDSKAYRLLCRLGIYRYQEIPRVTIAEVEYLLWDLPISEKKQVIESLQRRHLVEFHKGEFWLHPVIREEAIARLSRSKEFPNNILQAMNQEIARILAEEELQEFLRWVKQKSHLVKNEDKINYKLPAIRALYFDLEIDRTDNRIRNRVPSIFKCTHSLDSSLYFEESSAINVDHKLYFILVLARAIAPELASYLDVDYADNLVPELGESLRHLKNKLPEPYTEKFKKWRKDQGRIWVEELRVVIFKHRKIGHNWQFNTQQKEVLKQYYEANMLLIDCLKSTSNEVRSRIEDELFLPISEIQKRRQSD